MIVHHILSPHYHAGSVAAHHAFLGCAYAERFHNQKIKAFFRDAMYGENREKIVRQWVLSKVPRTLSRIIVFSVWWMLLGQVVTLVQATKDDAESVLRSIDRRVASDRGLPRL